MFGGKHADIFLVIMLMNFSLVVILFIFERIYRIYNCFHQRGSPMVFLFASHSFIGFHYEESV